MTTVGYGDYYPSGVLGRLIVVVACALGPFMISTTTLAINNAISFKITEEKAHQNLLSEFSIEKLKVSAVKVLSAFFKINVLRNRNESPFIHIFWLREEVLEFSKLRSLKIIQDLQAKPFSKLIFNLNRNLSIESDILIDNVRVIKSIQEIANYASIKQAKINREFEYLITFVRKLKILLNEMNIVPFPPDVIIRIKEEEAIAKLEITEQEVFQRGSRKRTTLSGKSIDNKKRSNLLDEKSFLDYIKKSPFRKKRIDVDSRLHFDIQDSTEIVKNLAHRAKNSKATVEGMKKIGEIQYHRSTLRGRTRNFGSNLVSEMKQFASRDSFEEKDSLKSNFLERSSKTSRSLTTNKELFINKLPRSRESSAEDFNDTPSKYSFPVPVSK